VNGRTLVLMLVGLISLSLRADDFQRVLLPVFTGPAAAPGANGSQWRTELVVENRGATDVLVGPCARGFPVPVDSTCPPSLLVYPRESVLHDVDAGPGLFGLQGRFAYLLTADLANLQLDLGLEEGGRMVARLPVVRESDFSSGTLSLMNLTVSDASRTALRIYGLLNHATPVRVQVFLLPEPRQVAAALRLADLRVTLTPSPFVAFGTLPLAPSYAQLSLDAVTSRASVYVKITNDDDEPLWAFATITANAISSVVVVTPASY
jgi:hypothetical protein